MNESTSLPYLQQSGDWIVSKSRQLLLSRGSSATAEELAPQIFGLMDSSRHILEFWSSQLEKTLHTNPQIFKCSAAGWELNEWDIRKSSLDDLTYVVLDFETTGLRPGRHSIIEVAAVKVEHGQVVDTFQKLVKPKYRVPDFIAGFTGITNEMVEEAEQPEVVLRQFVDFLGPYPVVGHNVGFDLSFLAAGLRDLNIELPTIGIDTIALSRYIWPGIRRYRLDAIAQRLGVNVPAKRHRALVDVMITKDIFQKFLEILKTQGIATCEELEAILHRKTLHVQKLSQPAEEQPTGMVFLEPMWRSDYPTLPGVYLMRDAAGEIIYIGKAKNLKNRLSTYFHHPLGYKRKIDGLLESVKSIEVRTLGSELEALLVESRLIKEYQPRYNVQLRTYPHSPFIKVDLSEPYPRVYATREVKLDGARYFGPFASGRTVETALEVIHKIFPVRTCLRVLPPDAAPSIPCMRYSMHRCLAPCLGAIEDGQYRRVVDEIIHLLSGDTENFSSKLRREMWQAVHHQNFEKAANLRDAIRSIDQVLVGQKLVGSTLEKKDLFIVYPSSFERHIEVFAIRTGMLVFQKRIKITRRLPGQIINLLKKAIKSKVPAKSYDLATLDQIHIISRWIHQHSQERGFFELPGDNNEHDISECSTEIISCIQEQLSEDKSAIL